MSTPLPWWDRLNNLLRPRLGPPPLGPYGEPDAVHDKPCPVCGHDMAGHHFEHRAGMPTLMHCPVPSLVE